MSGATEGVSRRSGEGMTTHTPGPWAMGSHDDWTVDGPPNFTSWHVIAEGRDPPIAILCEPGFGSAQIDANAALIVAAPDLLAALQALLDDSYPAGVEENVEVREQALAAIAKATGAAS